MLQTSVYLVGLSVFNGIHLPCIIKNTQAAHCVDIQSVEMDTQLGLQCIESTQIVACRYIHYLTG